MKLKITSSKIADLRKAQEIFMLIKIQKKLKMICEGSVLCPKLYFTFADFSALEPFRGIKLTLKLSLSMRSTIALNFLSKNRKFSIIGISIESSHCFHDS